MIVELDTKYAECCKESKNWEYCCIAGEIICNKCGRVLEDDIVKCIVLV